MRLGDRGTIVVGGLSLAYLLAYPLAIGRADESHLLYGAKRILDGQVIYRDFYETLTPLGFYLFAGLYRVAGTTLVAARVLAAVINAVGCALLFRLVGRIAGATVAAIAVLLYAGVCIPVWPYASLHWISTTLGLLIAAVTLSVRWRGSSRMRPLAAGMLAGVAVCTQQQRGVFIAAWLPLAFAVLAAALPRARRWATLGREIGWGAAGGAVVAVLVLGHAAWTSSPEALADALVGFAFKHYGPTHSGWGWAAVLPFTDVNLRSTWHWLLRGSPVFVVVEGLLLLARGRGPWESADLERGCLWLLAALMTVSIAYLTDFIHISFVLPFMLLPAARIVQALRSGPGRHVVTAGVWVVLIAVGAKAVANVSLAHALAPARFATAFGTVDGSQALEDLFETTRRHLERPPQGRPVLYSYPDDAWLYLALDADNPTRFNALVVGFFPPEHVAEVVDVLRARRPETVVLLTAATPPPIRPVVEEAYEGVEDVDRYRIYVRNP